MLSDYFTFPPPVKIESKDSFYTKPIQIEEVKTFPQNDTGNYRFPPIRSVKKYPQVNPTVSGTDTLDHLHIDSRHKPVTVDKNIWSYMGLETEKFIKPEYPLQPEFEFTNNGGVFVDAFGSSPVAPLISSVAAPTYSSSSNTSLSGSSGYVTGISSGSGSVGYSSGSGSYVTGLSSGSGFVGYSSGSGSRNSRSVITQAASSDSSSGNSNSVNIGSTQAASSTSSGSHGNSSLTSSPSLNGQNAINFILHHSFGSNFGNPNASEISTTTIHNESNNASVPHRRSRNVTIQSVNNISHLSETGSEQGSIHSNNNHSNNNHSRTSQQSQVSQPRSNHHSHTSQPSQVSQPQARSLSEESNNNSRRTRNIRLAVQGQAAEPNNFRDDLLAAQGNVNQSVEVLENQEVALSSGERQHLMRRLAGASSYYNFPKPIKEMTNKELRDYTSDDPNKNYRSLPKKR